MDHKLSEPQVLERLDALAGWSRKGASIAREFTFPDFPTAVQFVNLVAEAAEEAQHHPDIDIRYTRVLLLLTTHSAGGLTDKDFALAERLNSIASKEPFR